MKWKILIAHAKGEEALAEKLAEPLRQAGYEVAHRGTVLVGDSVVEEASKVLNAGGPVVLCGTVRAIGTKWARHVVNAATAYERVRVFAVQMEDEVDLESLSLAVAGVTADYWRDATRATQDLLTSLRKYYPLHDTSPDAPLSYDAEQLYRKLALKSCDIIDLANLPDTERDLVTRRLELRRLYVPLRVRLEFQARAEPATEELLRLEARRELLRRTMWSEEASDRHPVGERLARARRLVILGDPGAGKSTLIRWIATAYLLRLKQDPDWQALPDAATLPDEDWLPILIRCRDLDPSSADGALDDMLWRTLSKAELPEQQAQALRKVLRDRLEQGRAILLIDGVDEITDTSVRSRFCQQVEQIHVACPEAPIVVTSRIVGYREMKQRIGQGFEHLVVTDLSREEKDDFAVRWSKLTAPERWRTEADELIGAIHSKDRIERLTGNPMLLTTLALVKRKVGKLPRRRAELYSEAVQVLLNWRSAVDKPIDTAEAFPQLEYVAYAMCERGVQQLRKDEILDLLHRMREEYPQIHVAREHTPEHFLLRLEARTGILVEAGLVRHLGMMAPVLEFRHLSFQEYLAARALVEGRFPGRDRTRSLAANVAPLAARMDRRRDDSAEVRVDESWREALRLCVACCNDDDVDDVLLAILEPLKDEDASATARPRAILAALCLADEPNTREHVARTVLERLVGQLTPRDGTSGSGPTSLEGAITELATSRWAPLLLQLLIDNFYDHPDLELRMTSLTLAGVMTEASAPPDDAAFGEWLAQQTARIDTGDRRQATEATMSVLRLLGLRQNEHPWLFDHFTRHLMRRLRADDPANTVAALVLGFLSDKNNTTDNNTPLWIPSPEDIEHLLQLFTTPGLDFLAYLGLMLALAQTRSARAVEPVIARLKDPERYVREAAAGTLGELGDGRAVLPLLALLQDSSSDVRSTAAEALGKLRDARAVDPLLSLLEDPDPAVRNAAAKALVQLRDPRAAEPLLARLDDSDPGMKNTAAEALRWLCEEHTLPPLLARLEDSAPGVKIALIQSLRALRDERAVPPLLARLEDPDPGVRAAAVKALRWLRDERTVAPIISRLEDPDPDVRNAAAEALGWQHDARAVQPLISRLEDPDPGVKAAAAEALGLLGDARAVQPLLDLLADPAPDVTVAAVKALGWLRDTRAIQPLLARIEGPDSFEVMQALGRIGTEEVATLLTSKLRSSDQEMRSSALGALSWLHTDMTEQKLLSRDLDGLRPAMDPQDEIGPERVHQAANELRMTEDEVRRHYEALAQRFPLRLAWTPHEREHHP